MREGFWGKEREFLVGLVVGTMLSLGPGSHFHWGSYREPGNTWLLKTDGT